jgi:hypothetical protein
MGYNYTLMHKTLPVAAVSIDEITSGIYRMDELYHPEHLPLIVPQEKSKNATAMLNEWWLGRAIPASRSGIREALEIMHVSSPKLLLLKCFGLSLSDQYWVRPSNKDLSWESVNFFQNDFSEDVGNALFGREAGGGINLSSPDNTSDGWLKKKWVIADGKRVLLKGGSNPFYQEPFNEVLASSIMKRLNIPHAPYTLVWDKGQRGEGRAALSACEDFVTPDSELISAWNILSVDKKLNHESNHQYFLRCCEKLGIPGAADFIDRMLAVDYIVANEDRHYNNFGALRNPETLEWLGMAPVYDTGTALWYGQVTEAVRPRFKLPGKPFKNNHDDLIKCVRSFDWLDFGALKGIDEEYAEIIKEDNYVNEERRSKLCLALRIRVQMLEENK